jgi:prepilin-type N-terminal cleavage/methylation domain-containing protein
MKINYLSKNIFKKENGFTLVELLVVISIIAVLSTIGMVIYTGAQKRARDAQRREEVDAISKALEIAKPNTSAIYPAVTSAMFSANSIPQDPRKNGHYCLTTSADPNTPTTLPADNNVVYTTIGVDCKNPWYPVDSNTDPNWTNGVSSSSTVTSWTVCTALETDTSKPFCKKSSQ